jgi:hypothetical protein
MEQRLDKFEKILEMFNPIESDYFEAYYKVKTK